MTTTELPPTRRPRRPDAATLVALSRLVGRVGPVDDPGAGAGALVLEERPDDEPAPPLWPRRRRPRSGQDVDAPDAPRAAHRAARVDRAVPIDPRIRARRVAVRRTEGRRRLRVLTALAVVVAGLLTAYGIARSPVLDVDRVELTGSEQVDPAFVLAAAGVDVGEPILFVDLDAVAARLERLPWIAGVTVSRSLPGTVAIAVTERVPVAWIGLADGRALGLDGEGVVVGLLDGPRPDLVELRFDAPPAAALGAAIPEAAGASRYAAAVRDGRHDLSGRGGLARIDVSGTGTPPAADPVVPPPATDPLGVVPAATTATATDGVPSGPAASGPAVEGAAADATAPALGGAQLVQALAGHVARLGDGTEVRLGDGDDIDDKLDALETVLAHLDGEAVRYVDVAVPRSPAIGVVDAGAEAPA